MSDVGEKLHLGAQEGADAGDVDSALMWRPHNTEVRESSMIYNNFMGSDLVTVGSGTFVGLLDPA